MSLSPTLDERISQLETAVFPFPDLEDAFDRCNDPACACQDNDPAPVSPEVDADLPEVDADLAAAIAENVLAGIVQAIDSLTIIAASGPPSDAVTASTALLDFYLTARIG